MYLRYGIPKGLKSLFSNWRINANSTLILSCSMAVMGIIVLLYLNVLHFSQSYLANTKVSVFLVPAISREDGLKLLARINNHPLVKTAVLVSPKEGLKELAGKLGADHLLLTGAGLEGIPHTIDFEILADHRKRVGGLAARFRKMEGVADVVYTERMLETVELFFIALKSIGWFFIVLLTWSVYLVVSHATRLSLYSRREEIEILNLVGATRRFIRSSFVVEGLMVSLLGGAVAVGIVWLSQQLLISGLSWNEATAAVMKSQSIFFRVRDLGIALLCAAALGAMSSFIAVNRLLQDFEP